MDATRKGSTTPVPVYDDAQPSSVSIALVPWRTHSCDSARCRSVPVQADAVTTHDTGTAAVQLQSSAVQCPASNGADTDAGYDSAAISQYKGRGVTWHSNHDTVENIEKISAFLTAVLPEVEDALRENVRLAAVLSEADKSTNSDAAAYDEIQHASITLARTLLPRFNATEDSRSVDALVPTSITWNMNGSTLAVSLGRFDVPGWCSSPGELIVWSLSRNNTYPMARCSADSCVQTACFHPDSPALVAAGTINGDVLLFDLRYEDEDPLIARSRLSDASHREPVTEVHWCKPHNHGEQGQWIHEMMYELISVSSDGRILVWKPNKLQLPLFGYELRPQSSLRSQLLWGGTCMDFIAHGGAPSSTGIALGTDSGHVLTGWMNHSKKDTDAFSKAIQDENMLFAYRSPVAEEHDNHSAYVNDIAVSPFDRSLFATCSSDGTIAVRSTGSVHPAIILEPTAGSVTSCSWSPTRPLVLYTSTSDGNIAVYDLMQSRLQPAESIVATAETSGNVQAMAATTSDEGLLASASGCGEEITVRVWQLGTSLIQQRRNERQKLREVSKAAAGSASATEDAYSALPA